MSQSASEQIDSSPNYRVFAEKLGSVVDLCSQLPSYRMMPLVNLRAWTIPAIELDQVVFFYGPSGAAVGYFSWAYLDYHDALCFLQGRSAPFVAVQRLDGPDFWITDLVALPGAVRIITKYIRDVVVPEVKVLNFRSPRTGRHARYDAEKLFSGREGARIKFTI